MNFYSALRRSGIRALFAAGMAVFAAGTVRADTYDITTTNLVNTWVTNIIEVRIPSNHFVNRYYTNWVDHFGTNLIGRYLTNWRTITVTNLIPVEAFSTNHLKTYSTNLTTVTLTNDITVDRFKTNFVDSYHTNWKTLLLTKDVAVDGWHTNVVDQYRTNLKTLTLTNWETVLVMRTNWVNQPVTNMVQLDIPASAAATPTPAPPKPAPVETKTTKVEMRTPPSAFTDAVLLEAARTSRQPRNGHVEVELRARWKASDEPLLIQQWRVQAIDGAVLCFGQEQQFRRELPVGKYRVEVRLQRDSNSPFLTAVGELLLLTNDAIVHQELAASK
jgi:hypothetical protein